MKKITHSLVAMFALIATTAFAVDPVAVWNGDFNESEKGGISITANSNTIASDGSNITIADSSKGVQFDLSQVSDFGQRISVIVKYADLNQSGISGNKSLISVGQVGSGKTTYDDVGVRTTGSTAFTGYYSNTGNYGSQTYTAPKSGYILFNYSVEADHNIGVRYYIGEKNDNGTYTWSGRIGADNLRLTAAVYRFTKLAVGGPNSSNNGPIAGMKIEAVAIFNSDLDTAAAAVYVFPEPEVETVVLTNDNGTGSLGGVGNYQPDALLIPDSSGIEAGKIVTVKSVTFALDSSAAANANWISINGVQSSSKTISGTWPNTAYPLVTYNYGDGVDIEIGKSAPMVASGDSRWRLFANVTDADRQYIGMTNTTDMNRGYRPAYKIVLEVPIGDVKNPSKAEIEDDSIWENLGWDVVPTASDKAELTVSANAKLTIDNNTAFKSLKLIGQRNLTIAGITSSNIALISKINTSSFTGKLTFEIDASSGLTADTALKNFIKAADTKCTFIFKGAGNKGVTINYGTEVNETLNTHIVFEGGTHALTYGQGVESKDFGANASNENPTVWVKNSTTLNFTAKDLTGWNGTANANGVIRVDNGATLNFLASGRNTIYYRQRLCLESGAKVNFPNVTGQNDSKPVVRFLGGTAESKEVIYVLPSTGNETTATISGNIFLAKDDTHGFGIFVGENSRLKWTGDMSVYDNNDDKAIVKRGIGMFEYNGTMDGVTQVLAGSIGGDGSLRKLTLSGNASLNLDNGAPTITGSLITETEKQLKLVTASPYHGMPVMTLPAAADKTGWTAYVNGRSEANDLKADGNTLTLVWKIPPTVVEIDPEADIEAKPSVDYTKSTVSVKVNYSGYGDYAEGDMGYQIIIGENTYTGVASGEGDEKTVSFEIDELEGGKIYRGEFQVVYGEDDETAATAPIVIRQGKLVYVEKDPWVNETPLTLKTTGSYDPESGVSVVGEMIQVNTSKEVTFTPTPDPDYVDKCDSSFTISIMADEAIDADDNTVEDDAQAGVQIVADGTGGAIFQFVAGDEWVNGPTAELNKLYDVAISFHYAKGDVDGDKDSVTYIVGEWKRTYDRRENTANKVEEIIFYDGCQFAKLVGTCEIESADPVPQGIKPGEKAEIAAKNAEDAQKQAAGMPVLIPDDELVVAALDTDQKKANYKALFKVIAVKKNGSYTAEVVFDDDKISTIKDDEENILTEVVKALGSLVGEEGELENITGQPGLYYGIATDGELVKMDEAEPTEWQIADASGNIIGLKVKKTGKQGFYKVICTPVKPAKKSE